MTFDSDSPENLDFVSFSGLHFVRLKPGRVMLGALNSDADAEVNERPRIEYEIARSFWMASTCVTVEQWARFLELPEGEYCATRARQAANYISWHDARQFVNALNHNRPQSESDCFYDLPTEAEWEYACRAGTNTRFYYGDDPDYKQLADHAWYYENAWKSGSQGPMPVGLLPANPWGLYDMHGNVWEWTGDGWASYEAIMEFGESARDARYRTIRGGGWCHDARYIRASDRDFYEPDYRHYYTGLRVVCREIVKDLRGDSKDI